MERQDAQANSDLSEATAALRDLARLCLSHGSTQMDEQSTVATKLLERLMALCCAQHGAVVLVPVPAPSQEPFLSPFPSTEKASHIFALLNMKEEEVWALLTPLPPEGMWTSPSSREPCWLVWKPDLVLSLPQQHDAEGEHEADRRFHALQMLVMLGWSEQGEETRGPLVTKARVLLPQVVEGVAVAITQVLMAERVFELETVVDRRALREMELLKAELLASVSHELRSPLASIKGYAATLLRHERRISREERHEFLLAITEASDRLANVVDHLLEISELKTGTITIAPSAMNLTHLLHEAVAVAQQRFAGQPTGEHTLADQRQTFLLRFEGAQGRPSGEDLIIQADQNRLREVLDNVLENAMLHSPEHSTITITIRLLTTHNRLSKRDLPSPALARRLAVALHRYQRMVEIRVHDEGKGIAKEHLERIFEPFYRVDNRLTREVNGLGLGLAICQHIVELHGGLIWAESVLGQGSTFTICLPINGSEENQEVHSL